MIARYFGHVNTQKCDVANEFPFILNACQAPYIQQYDNRQAVMDVSGVLEKSFGIAHEHCGCALSEIMLTKEVLHGRPVMAGLVNSAQGKGHMVVIRGYRRVSGNPAQFLVHDPLAAFQGHEPAFPDTVSYNHLIGNTDYGSWRYSWHSMQS